MTSRVHAVHRGEEFHEGSVMREKRFEVAYEVASGIVWPEDEVKGEAKGRKWRKVTWRLWECSAHNIPPNRSSSTSR